MIKSAGDATHDDLCTVYPLSQASYSNHAPNLDVASRAMTWRHSTCLVRIQAEVDSGGVGARARAAGRGFPPVAAARPRRSGLRKARSGAGKLKICAKLLLAS